MNYIPITYINLKLIAAIGKQATNQMNIFPFITNYYTYFKIHYLRL